ncbi:MAG: CoB--CoM heterodisulfide reductase iron-sulfur subunit B family protein, partial [Proteobacteria bacterium]|nr:CoB--CoM heterodisulfide reductase iron-sulfur subunit B family protein [Pseudomonadota bacterium]MBU1596637.1 CoB--CoM heterodisulfide reductase iron-sulfur subunit B family protein [Pseudomonadota bacterium]
MSAPAPLTLAYYPGCSQTGTAAEYDCSSRACCAALGVTLIDVPDWTCCGSTPAHTVDHHLAGALAARNLLQAELAGHDRVATPCPSCLAALRTASRHLALPEPAEGLYYRAEVERLLDRPAPLRASAVSLLQVLDEDVGQEAIAAAITRPLAGLRVAPYYGCIMNRPPGLMDFDDPENPTALDRLLAACGATVVDFPFKTECCGAAFGMPRLDMMQRLSARILDMAEECGADAIVVACPLCQMNLDLRRSQVNAASGSDNRMPVPYFTQLLGLALGLDGDGLGLDKLVLHLGPALAAAEARAAA